MDWEKDTSGLSLDDLQRAQPYKMEGHSWVSSKKLPWPYCKRCKLLKLRNRLTDWCVKHGCNSADHPGYKSAVKTLSGH